MRKPDYVLVLELLAADDDEERAHVLAGLDEKHRMRVVQKARAAWAVEHYQLDRPRRKRTVRQPHFVRYWERKR